MRKLLIAALIIGVLPTICYSQRLVKDSIKVFFLGGQSNMVGFGYNSDLPDSLNDNFSSTWIYHGNPGHDEKRDGGQGRWTRLGPGHGVGFSSDGTTNHLSKRFGIELSFAKRLEELYPNEKIALIKYAKSGSSLDSLAAGKFGSWEADFRGRNGINQYDHFLEAIKRAYGVDDINGDGRRDVLVPCGIIWMQGEADAAFTESIANNYYKNLKRLMDLIRASLHADDLPVVLGKISDSCKDKDGRVWNYGELVQYAQEKYSKLDKNAEIVRDTRYYKYCDRWHYDSNGYIHLGIEFADAIYRLNQ